MNETAGVHPSAFILPPSSLRVAIDCRTIRARKTGDRTYTLNLLAGLAQNSGGFTFDLLLDGPDSDGVLPSAPHFRVVEIPAKNSRLWTLVELPKHVRQAKPDLVHLQYLAPPWLGCPFVTTIHDVVWRAMPQTFPLLDRVIMNLGMPLTAKLARRILTVSKASKRGIIRYLRAKPDKIDVTYNAVDARFFEPILPKKIAQLREKYGLGEKPYILSVGVLQPRKNVSRLIEAFLKLGISTHNLVITGKRGWGDQSSIVNHQSSIIETGYVDDADLPALYAGADVFAYPSLYEGFGLPVIEAMAANCPVLTSNRSSLPEVAGGAALLVEPHNVEKIAEGLKKLLDDAALRENLRNKGHERAKFFTVAAQTEVTLQSYRASL